MNDVELVAVRTFLNKIEAQIAQGALKAANIEVADSPADMTRLRHVMAPGASPPVARR